MEKNEGHIVFVLILAVALLFRSLTLFSPELLKIPDMSFYITRPRDIGIIGQMSLRALAGEFPLFFYGQNFMGSLEVFLNLPLFLLLGASPYSLQVLPIMISVIFIVLVYLLARRFSGPRVAQLCSLWLAIPPVFLMKWDIEARSHYPLTLILGTILIHLTCRIINSRDRNQEKVIMMASWGLIAGLGFWTNMLIMAYIIPAVFLLWVDDKKFIFKPVFPLALGSLVVGSLPFLVFQEISGWPIRQVSQTLGSLPFSRMKDLITNALPILIGFVPPVRYTSQQVILLLLAGLYSASLVYFLFRRRQYLWSLVTFRRIKTSGSELLVLILITNLLLSLFTDFSKWLPNHCQRYLLPVYTVFPIFVFTFLNDWKTRAGRWGLIVVTTFLLGFHFWGNFVQDTWLILQPKKFQVFRQRLAREYELVGFLQRNRYDRIYCEDGIGKRLMLMAKNKLICSDPYQEVYPKYSDQVDASQKVGFLFYGENDQFENTLNGTGGIYRKLKSNDLYTLYGDFTPPPTFQMIPRNGWTFRGSPDPGESTNFIDGNIESGWSVPQVPGAGLLIDMGRVNSVSHIFFIPHNYREVPAGFQVEVSEDGQQWNLVSRISAYWGPFFWSGPHPMIKIRQGRVELSFPEIKARYINLTLTSEDKHRNWSVAEIFMGKTLQENHRKHTSKGLSDLLRFLKMENVQTVYADHWLSAVIRVESGRRLRTMPSNHFLGDNGENDPSPDQRFPVSFDPGTAFVLEHGNGPFFMELIRPGGMACDHWTLGPYEIFYNCGKKEESVLNTANWEVSANINRESSKKAVDRIQQTRWSSEKPQQPGMFFEVNLGKIFSVSGLTLSLGDSRGDFPRRLKILGSKDGKSWSEIKTDWTSDFYWAGNVLLKMRGKRINYFFSPVDMKFLRMVQEGSDPEYYWSIHELTVYGKRPERKKEVPNRNHL